MSADVVKKNFQEWSKFSSYLAVLVDIEKDNREKELVKNQSNLYDNEMFDERKKRAENLQEWVKTNMTCEKIDQDSILCGDDCWFNDNTDRLREYTHSYRLKGTSIYLCCVCKDNRDASSRDLDEEIELSIRNTKISGTLSDTCLLPK